MKKLAFTLLALAAFGGPAAAADIAARPYTKAPPPVAVAASWTGCYVGGGGGYGMWNQENKTFIDVPRQQLTDTLTNGGRGYFGTVQGGCDYQFADRFVIGAFADYDFGSLKGKITNDFVNEGGSAGTEKMSSAWSVGGRVGWIALPGLLTYFSAGYTEATFDRINFNFNSPGFFGVPNGIAMDKRTYKGYFIGAGDEYALNFLPGLFWKTEYRFSQFDTRTDPYLFNGVAFNRLEESRKWVHTVRSELVYRFNWGAPLIAKY